MIADGRVPMRPTEREAATSYSSDGDEPRLCRYKGKALTLGLPSLVDQSFRR